jgi:type II secretory pathway pseudopilin PulG
MMKPKPIILGDKRGYRRPSKLNGRFIGVCACIFVLNFVLWSMHSLNERARVKQALVDISRIEHAARLFRADHGRCPEDLEELVLPPSDRRYLQPTRDPWRQPYKLTCPARLDPGGVEVISGGPDKSIKGNDNISSL